MKKVIGILTFIFCADSALAVTLCGPVFRTKSSTQIQYIARTGHFEKAIIPLNREIEAKLSSLKANGEKVCFEGTEFSTGRGLMSDYYWMVYDLNL